MPLLKSPRGSPALRSCPSPSPLRLGPFLRPPCSFRHLRVNGNNSGPTAYQAGPLPARGALYLREPPLSQMARCGFGEGKWVPVAGQEVTEPGPKLRSVCLCSLSLPCGPLTSWWFYFGVCLVSRLNGCFYPPRDCASGGIAAMQALSGGGGGGRGVYLCVCVTRVHTAGWVCDRTGPAPLLGPVRASVCP